MTSNFKRKHHSIKSKKLLSNAIKHAWKLGLLKGHPMPKNEKSSRWKGDNITIDRIHTWLFLNYGKANKCENLKCLGLSKKYDWAKIKGKPYLRRRNHFWKLCRKCHGLYDMTDERKKKISKSMKLVKHKRKNGKFCK